MNPDRRSRARRPKLRLGACLVIAGPIILGLAAAGGLGCAAVSQAERGYLSDPIMIFDENPIEKGVKEHYRDYREGSVGGTGAQSGGCGCG